MSRSQQKVPKKPNFTNLGFKDCSTLKWVIDVSTHTYSSTTFTISFIAQLMNGTEFRNKNNIHN